MQFPSTFFYFQRAGYFSSTKRKKKEEKEKNKDRSRFNKKKTKSPRVQETSYSTHQKPFRHQTQCKKNARNKISISISMHGKKKSKKNQRGKKETEKKSFRYSTKSTFLTVSIGHLDQCKEKTLLARGSFVGGNIFLFFFLFSNLRDTLISDSDKDCKTIKIQSSQSHDNCLTRP